MSGPAPTVAAGGEPGWPSPNRPLASTRSPSACRAPGSTTGHRSSVCVPTPASSTTTTSRAGRRNMTTTIGRTETPELVSTALLPPGFTVPASRWTHPSTRMRRLLETEPYLFGPGVYDPMGLQLAMYHGSKAVYFSGYSFAIGHLGTTDRDLYTGPEIADAAGRTVSALRKFQLTQAVGDPEKGIAPRHLEIPPLVVDMDRGYGNIFNVQRTTELYVNAGIAAAHIEDQVLPKRCRHIGGKALIAANEMIGKLLIARRAQPATAIGLSALLQAMATTEEQRYVALQSKECEPGEDFPPKSHHFFSGVPYHPAVGQHYDAARLGTEFAEALPAEKVV